ncbi:hypothetical protein N7481_006948 [Penicillium waksmanii]|uniref:uncharacterized protein n=1 Tax=Penicillium waksmanii TaxID=69791 RepID=UPI002549A827|nr:uncharacterized protein N7481_006948 [Penicillium waksmanii]KAJ5979650.1 hypothetical protein N7481_006948 [Penicillium waksmanii]
MSDVDEDVGHTVVHFLYTGGYETVSSPLDEGTLDLAREYKRSVLVYQASRTWGLTDLEILAQQKMQQLDKELPVLELLRVMRDIFSSLPVGETWVPGYIQANLQRSLKPNDPGLGLREFYDIIGQDHQFDNAVMKMIIEILSIRIFSMKDQQVKTPNGIISNRTPLQGPVSEGPESFVEEPEPAPEEPGPFFEEPGPTPEDPKPAPEETDCFPEEPEPFSEEAGPAPEEPMPAPEEPMPAPEEPMPAPEEPMPAPEEPKSVPEETECFPEEPEPFSEEPGPAPEEPKPAPKKTECFPEEPEKIPGELPAEAGSGLWTIPRASAKIGDWPRASLLPEDTPNAEIQEASGQGHIARISCSDLTLYEN